MQRRADARVTAMLGALGALALALPEYVLLPLSDLQRGVVYTAVSVAAVTIGVLGLRHHRPEHRRGWLLLWAGAAGGVTGDALWTVEQHLLPAGAPAPSDVLYLLGYLAFGTGALVLVWARPGSRDITAILDALIVTIGAGVVAGVFLIAPLAADSRLTVPERAFGSIYPLADLFLLGVVVRMFSVAGARTVSYRLLAAALSMTLLADTAFEVSALAPGRSGWAVVADVAWLACYLLVAAAACVPSMTDLGAPGPDRVGPIPSRGRLLALACGLALPGVVLLADGVAGGGTVAWPVIGIGTLLLSALVLLRMDGLLTIVQDQATRLSALARSDSLTGAPNRRTWDHELARACAVSRDRGATLCVAMVDLDRFKAFNDAHGHPAGDRLLQDAVRAWQAALPPDALLARYGGEEFAVLIAGVGADDLVRLLHRLRTVTPGGQTFSAGVSVWDPLTDPGSAVAEADAALYAAKRAGRDRIVVHGGPGRPHDGAISPRPDGRMLPAFTIVTQPIMELATCRISGHEALTRFTEREDVGDVPGVFRRAHLTGDGDLLELATIRAAMDLPDRPPEHDLFVNVSVRALTSGRFLEGLPRRLTGLVVELNEDPDDVPADAVATAVSAIRARGARIALDDVGAGAQEFARLATLRPDVVKVDRSLVAGCADDAVRTAVLLALVTYARQLGIAVCAEGVETLDDLRHLTGLGVTHAQGYLLAPPGQTWRSRAAVADAPDGATPGLGTTLADTTEIGPTEIGPTEISPAEISTVDLRHTDRHAEPAAGSA